MDVTESWNHAESELGKSEQSLDAGGEWPNVNGIQSILR